MPISQRSGAIRCQMFALAQAWPVDYRWTDDEARPLVSSTCTLAGGAFTAPFCVRSIPSKGGGASAAPFVYTTLVNQDTSRRSRSAWSLCPHTHFCGATGTTVS